MDLENVHFSVPHEDGKGTRSIRLISKSYANNRIALQAIDTDTHGYYAILTCNIPEYQLGDDEFLIKTWNENKKLAKAVIQTGVFIDTNKRVNTGFVEAQIWKLTKEFWI